MSESVVVHDGVDESKRTWLGWTCGAGAVAGVATAIPFVSTFAPSERAKAAGAAVEVDISDLQLGVRRQSNGAASRSGSCAARRR
jgi:Rieske Fe-S protein